MKDVIKILLALGVLLSGVALVPVVGLPTQGFSWQRYAGAYTPATLSINHASGQPGSFFSVDGANFTPDSTLDISVNGLLLGSVAADSNGNLVFMLDSTGADPGFYLVEASGGESAAAQLTLEDAAPLWSQEGVGPVFALPSGIATHRVLMPVIIR